MSVRRLMTGIGIGALGAAGLVVAPALLAQTAPQQRIAAAKRATSISSIGTFTPAAADPKLAAVLARSDANTKIIPGHGALANKADMQRFHDMLVKVRSNIQILITQGRTEDEVVAAKPTAEFDAAWGTGFMNPENFTRFAYQSLTRD